MRRQAEQEQIFLGMLPRVRRHQGRQVHGRGQRPTQRVPCLATRTGALQLATVSALALLSSLVHAAHALPLPCSPLTPVKTRS